MIEPASLAVFFAAALLLGISPGPDNLFVLAQSLIGGRRAGFMITLGLCTGLLVHTTAVALGVAAVIKTSSVAFLALKMAGAGYLLYLAWRAFRAGGIKTAQAGDEQLTSIQLYRRGIIMNVINPKVTMFFLAFLPQFINPDSGPVFPQILLLGAAFVIATLIIFNGIVLLAGWIGERLGRSTVAQAWLNRLSGMLFAGLAIRLLLTRQ
jgi:threonine/homoserine/homoserine lactone efflux protein